MQGELGFSRWTLSVSMIACVVNLYRGKSTWFMGTSTHNKMAIFKFANVSLPGFFLEVCNLKIYGLGWNPADVFGQPAAKTMGNGPYHQVKNLGVAWFSTAPKYGISSCSNLNILKWASVHQFEGNTQFSNKSTWSYDSKQIPEWFLM